MTKPLALVDASHDDFRRRAERRLPRVLFDYIDGGAGTERTLTRNTEDWQDLLLHQRVLVDASGLDCSIELFGEKLAMPLALAPIGMGGIVARRGEIQAKRAADAADVPFCLSTVSICSIEEISAVPGRSSWFQLYMLKDRGIVAELLERAWEQGVRTLVFTVDLAMTGTRFRDIRNGMSGGLKLWGRLRSGAFDYALHPGWLWDVGLNGGPHTFGNIARYVSGPRNPLDFVSWLGQQFDNSVTWKDIEWLRNAWKGNLVLKGILDERDAQLAVGIGADGIIVSNHGGRQLDGAASTARKLPHIADHVGSKTIVLVDGGIRTGQDLFCALALGAKAVLVGRPWAMALAAAGERGVDRMLSSMKQDLRTTMALTGISKVDDIGRSSLLVD
ncbi:L-lactate dehydrogenase [Erythrobacter sp. NFXS35]|uniref:L-lactate dehydrogenase n=1 Tax=Erythrobacter sp. NFXS35 TaxID=2818436 RepID=UPI0032DFC025